MMKARDTEANVLLCYINERVCMKKFGSFAIDKEKDIIVDLYIDGESMFYVLRTPNHGTGNLIRNLAKLCDVPLSEDGDGLLVMKGPVPAYIDGNNRRIYILRLANTKIANIFPDGTIEKKVSIPAIAKTLMSQTKDYRLDYQQTIVKSYIFDDCKFHTDLHTHMNANLTPDVLIALGLYHQLRYPLYYVRKLGLRLSGEQETAVEEQRVNVEADVLHRIDAGELPPLKGKYLRRKINDNTFINFADLIFNNIGNADYNIPKIRASLAIMKDGQAVFTNLEKVYLYRYVFCKGKPYTSQSMQTAGGSKKVADPTDLYGRVEGQIDITEEKVAALPDTDIATALRQMLTDRRNPAYAKNSLLQDELLWIARTYQSHGIRYAEISDTTLTKPKDAPKMLQEVHAVMPAITRETGVVLRFLAAIRRIPLTIVRDQVSASDYVKENLRTLSGVACDPYVAGSDIIGEEMNDIRDLQPVIAELTKIAAKESDFVIRIHAGENDSLRDNVDNSVRCVMDALAPGQTIPRIRIGHGLYTANLKTKKGEQLLSDLRKSGVVLEFQISSNVRLNNLTELSNHPLKKYLEAGIPCVQGTDGGAIYGTDSMDEQLALEKMLKLSHEDMRAMRATDDRLLRESLDGFHKKEQRFDALLSKEMPVSDVDQISREAALNSGSEALPQRESDGRIERLFVNRIETTGTEYENLFLSQKKYVSSEILKDRISAMPTDRLPVILAGGSFNSDAHMTRMHAEEKGLIDTLLRKCDPKEVFFVIGDSFTGYEKYLVDRNKGQFDIYSFVPSMIGETEKENIIRSGVHVRIALESTTMGVYKSFAYEIFKRRESVLLALDGNASGANMIQEAKNGKEKCYIFVGNHSLALKRKAESLEGYVTILQDEAAGSAAVLDAIRIAKKSFVWRQD